MIPPAIGEEAEVVISLTHTEYTTLVDAVEQIESGVLGKTTEAAARWLNNVTPVKRGKFVNAAALLARLVKEQIIEE